MFRRQAYGPGPPAVNMDQDLAEVLPPPAKASELTRRASGSMRVTAASDGRLVKQSGEDDLQVAPAATPMQGTGIGASTVANMLAGGYWLVILV